MTAHGCMAWAPHLFHVAAPVRRPLESANVLVTGGLGFLGSNLAIQLVESGANVTIFDALLPQSGGNWFNLAPIEDRATVVVGDIRDRDLVEDLVANQHFIIHAAAQVSHTLGLRDPFPDIDINLTGTAALLEACRRNNNRAPIIKLGSRGQYGRAQSLPVREDAPTMPLGVYELTLHAAEQLSALYHRVHGLPVVLLRLANIYGPRAQMRHANANVANWFVRLAMDRIPIPLYGTGQTLRDFVYVDDCVDAILRLATCPDAIGQTFNIGSERPTSFIELAETIVAEVGHGSWTHTPYSTERSVCEPGDFYCSTARVRGVVGWSPRTPLAAGVRQTIEYYRGNREHYWEPAALAA